jgi:hypothetical protein
MNKFDFDRFAERIDQPADQMAEVIRSYYPEYASWSPFPRFGLWAPARLDGHHRFEVVTEPDGYTNHNGLGQRTLGFKPNIPGRTFSSQAGPTTSINIAAWTGGRWVSSRPLIFDLLPLHERVAQRVVVRTAVALRHIPKAIPKQDCRLDAN